MPAKYAFRAVLSTRRAAHECVTQAGEPFVALKSGARKAEKKMASLSGSSSSRDLEISDPDSRVM